MINVQQSLRKEKREKKKKDKKKRPKPLILVAHAKNSLEGKSEFWADRLPHSVFHHATGLISSY
jgi:hypothetical protein